MPDWTVGAAVVATSAVAIGLLSYFRLTRKSGAVDRRETRASRAVYDACEAAILIGSTAVGRLIGEVRHAPFFGVLFAIALGALAGGAIWAVSRRQVARLLAGALRER